MLETCINKKILTDNENDNNDCYDDFVGDDDRTLSIGSNDAVVILNPTKYTIQDDSGDDNDNEY